MKKIIAVLIGLLIIISSGCSGNRNALGDTEAEVRDAITQFYKERKNSPVKYNIDIFKIKPLEEDFIAVAKQRGAEGQPSLDLLLIQKKSGKYTVIKTGFGTIAMSMGFSVNQMNYNNKTIVFGSLKDSTWIPETDKRRQVNYAEVKAVFNNGKSVAEKIKGDQAYLLVVDGVLSLKDLAFYDEKGQVEGTLKDLGIQTEEVDFGDTDNQQAADKEVYLLNESEVLSLQVDRGMPTMTEPEILYMDDERDKVIIRKIMKWLNEAEVMGSEKPYGKHGYPDSLTINLHNGKVVFIEPAFEIHTKKYSNGSTSSTAAPIKGQLAVNFYEQNELQKRVKIKSDNLYKWLDSAWEKELKLVGNQFRQEPQIINSLKDKDVQEDLKELALKFITAEYKGDTDILLTLTAGEANRTIKNGELAEFIKTHKLQNILYFNFIDGNEQDGYVVIVSVSTFMTSKGFEETHYENLKIKKIKDKWFITKIEFDT